jgi:hypothetical protein
MISLSETAWASYLEVGIWTGYGRVILGGK